MQKYPYAFSTTAKCGPFGTSKTPAGADLQSVPKEMPEQIRFKIMSNAKISIRFFDHRADSEVLKKELAAYQYDLLYINDQAHIAGYQPIEEVFKNKMLS